MKGLSLFLSGLFFIIFLVNYICAFGISSAYYREMPLVMSPGETRDIEFGRLQNMVEGEEEMVLLAEISEGEDIAQIIDPDSQYLVSYGVKNVSVNMRVSIPQGAELNSKYKITVKFRDITGVDSEEMIALTTITTKSIPVLIKGKELPVSIERKDLRGIWFSFLVFFLISAFVVLIYLLVKNKIFVKRTYKETAY